MKNLFLNHNKKKGVLETFVAWFMAFSLVMQGLGGLPLVAFAGNEVGASGSSAADPSLGANGGSQTISTNSETHTETQVSKKENFNETTETVDNSIVPKPEKEKSQGQETPIIVTGNVQILQTLAMNMNLDPVDDDIPDDDIDEQNDGHHKVTICHIPKGKPENAHSVTVDEHSVKYDGHLRHGDKIGPCEKTPPPTIPPVKAPITIVASKIVCDAESKLPNWGFGGPDITSTTATDYVSTHPGCALTPDWKFQWGYQGVGDAGGTLVGEAPNTGTSSTDWKTFGPTDTNGVATVSINNVDHSSVIWVREVLRSGYVPFTFDSTHQQNDNNVSAEMYCHTDVLNYDNYDYVNVPEAGHTYYCVAFNALKNTPPPPPPPTSCTLDIVSDTSDKLVGGAYATATYSSNPRWTASIPGATWIWKTFFVSDPTHDETANFTKDFTINGTVASATMTLAADNSFSASVNSNVVGSDNTEFNYFEENKHVYDVAASLHTGINTVSFEVKNWAQAGGNAQSNPAGLLYKLHVVYLSSNSNCTPPPPQVNTPPVITLKGDNPLIVTQGSVFSDPGATSTDNEDGDLTGVIVATGTVDTSVLGTTTRTYTVTDSGGLSASTTRIVIVKDIYLPPMNACEGVYGKVISSVDGWGFHSDNTPEHYTVYDGQNQPTHGDTLDNSWVHASGQGHSITWSLSADTKTVRVFTSNDHGPYPAEFEEYNVLVSHDNITWSAPLTATATYVGDINNVKVHDGVKDFVSTSSFRYVRLVQNGISGADFEIDAIKSCGEVTNEAPVITLIGANPLTVYLNSAFVEPGANATDVEDCVGLTQSDCNSALHLTATGTVNTSVVGSHDITYTAVDSGGLHAVPKTRTVKVVTQCSDGIDNDGDGLVDYPLDLGCDNSTDNNENAPPVITVVAPNPTVVTVGATFTDLGANATDSEDCIGQTQAQCNTTLHLTPTGTVNTAVVGTYTITYNATDSKNLAATPKTRTVNVVSAPGCTVNCGGATNTPPTITLIGTNPLVIHINTTFVDPGANASDTEDCVGKTQTQCNSALHLTAKGTVDMTNVGNYVITYSATDSQNLAATPVTRTVKVESACSDGVDNDGDGKIDFPNDMGCTNPNDDSENQKPVITLIGDVVMQLVVGTSFTDPSATVADPEDGNITNKLVATGTVDQNTVGSYTITYNATDSQNLAATPVTRTVNVVSAGCTSNCGGGGGSGNTRPVITVLGANPLSVTQNTAFTDPGATAYDSEDGNITSKIVATGTVNTAVLGAYTITYDVSDSQNLPAQQKSRVVNVVVAGNPGCTANCGGGGGGGGSPSLSITNEKLTVTGTTTVSITWDTNLAADSRVVYGLNSVPTLANPPYYGYQITTATDTALTLKHTVVINGIPSAITTYFRPVSSVSSLTATGIELTRQPAATVGGSCEYLKEYMRLGINNNPTEVTKLQLFLKNFEGFSDLAVTGFFDITTDRAVRIFQDKFKSDVLDPWDLPGNTGYVYYTTEKKINEIYCQREFPLNTTQLTEIASFRELIARINAQSTTAPILPLVGINTEGGNQGTVAGASTVKDPKQDAKQFEGITISDVPGTAEATETDNRGHIALSDLLAIPSSMSGELTDNNSTATDAGIVAGASTSKQGVAAVIDSLALRTHLTPLQVILVLLLVLLAIGSAIYFGFTKGPEVKSVRMNIDPNN